MLEGLPKPLKLDDKFTIELVFANAGNVPVEIWVEDGPSNLINTTTTNHQEELVR